MGRLTAKQKKFVDGILEGLSQAEAYRRAYSTEKMKPKTVVDKASALAKQGGVRAVINKRRKQMEDKAIWRREEALGMLRDIAVEARQNAVEKIVLDQSGVVIDKYNSAAQNVAIKAIEQANKMCGFNEAEKHEIDAVIYVELGEFEEFAE